MAASDISVQRKPLSWQEMTRQAMAEEARKQAPMNWEVPVDQLYAPSSDVPVSGGFAPGGAEYDPTPEMIASMVPWGKLAKAGARGVEALSEEIGAAMMRPSTYEITSPIKNVGHLSQQTKLVLKAPSEVHPNLRYDSGGGVFGRNTYFDETGDWVSSTGKYNQADARGIAGDVVYSADLAPQKALLVTPKNISKLQKKGLLPHDTQEIAAHLQPKGYDAIVIRGMDDKVQKASEKYSKLSDKLFEKVRNKEISFEEYRKQASKLYSDIFNKDFGSAGKIAETYQDQIVVFDPTKTVSRFEQLGPKSAVTKEMVQQGIKSEAPIERPLSSYIKRKIDKLPTEEKGTLYPLWSQLLRQGK
jgi:hypothetical protein